MHYQLTYVVEESAVHDYIDTSAQLHQGMLKTRLLSRDTVGFLSVWRDGVVLTCLQYLSISLAAVITFISLQTKWKPLVLQSTGGKLAVIRGGDYTKNTSQTGLPPLKFKNFFQSRKSGV